MMTEPTGVTSELADGRFTILFPAVASMRMYCPTAADSGVVELSIKELGTHDAKPVPRLAKLILVMVRVPPVELERGNVPFPRLKSSTPIKPLVITLTAYPVIAASF